MTEKTFYEDESPLIQLIVGEEWKQFKEFASSSGIDIEKDVFNSQNGTDFLKLENMAADMRRVLTNEYGKVFDSWQFSYNYNGGYEVLFENGLNLIINLPFPLSDELRFPQLEIHTNLKQGYKPENDKEFEEQVLTGVALVNTTSRFDGEGYPPTYEKKDHGMVWISKTQISEIAGLQKLVKDIIEIHESIEKRVNEEPEKIRKIYRRIKDGN